MACKLLLLLVLLGVSAAAAAWDPKSYECGACRGVVAAGGLGADKFADLCRAHMGEEACHVIFGENSPIMGSTISKEEDFCRKHGLCEHAASSRDYATYSTGTPSVRVTKALGSKGYNKIRLSLVSNSTISSSDFGFPGAYINQFLQKWTQFHLATAVVDVVPGETSSFSVGGKVVNVLIPKENEGTRGIVVADPCFQSEWVHCKYQDKWEMFERLTSLLNAASSRADEISFFRILGDNFYDRSGSASYAWFEALSLETKSKVLGAVPGNHDTWVAGAPAAYTSQDQLQTGFYQFYAQDTAASLSAEPSPYDFSVNVAAPDATAHTLPPAANLFTYTKLGNIVFIGFSGAQGFDDQKALFSDACSFADSAGADAVLLEGHWNEPGDGAPVGASVPEVFELIKSLPACQKVSAKMRYFEGHMHCNLVKDGGLGFMVGANGMSDSTSCGGVFGIPVVDTTGGSFKVYYFAINDEKAGKDYYEETLKCFTEKGVSSCYDLPSVVKWADVPF